MLIKKNPPGELAPNPNPVMSTSKKIECLKNGTHAISSISISTACGIWLSNIWTKNKMFTHHMHGKGGRSGGGVSYHYTFSFKIWKSRYKEKYEIVTGGSMGGKYHPRYKENEHKDREPLFNLYRFIQKYYPNQVLSFSLIEKKIYNLKGITDDSNRSR